MFGRECLVILVLSRTRWFAGCANGLLSLKWCGFCFFVGWCSDYWEERGIFSGILSSVDVHDNVKTFRFQECSGDVESDIAPLFFLSPSGRSSTGSEISNQIPSPQNTQYGGKHFSWVQHPWRGRGNVGELFQSVEIRFEPVILNRV